MSLTSASKNAIKNSIKNLQSVFNANKTLSQANIFKFMSRFQQRSDSAPLRADALAFPMRADFPISQLEAHS